MADDPRVQELLDELLERQTTPEAVCGTFVELLPIVRARWEEICRARAELDALLPAGPYSDLPSWPSQAPPLPALPGYEVEAVLGHGGMGVVYRARHLRLNRLVALKMPLPGDYISPQGLARFLREAKAVAGLCHEHIVQVFDAGEVDGRPYFTMELVEGGSLAQRLGGQPQSCGQAAELVATLADAVQLAHAAGIIHRDLKPANVLLSADGTPKISDFGLARHLGGETALTRSGAALGTPSYMAPEQAAGETHAIGPAVDVYALGAILYELLTGRPPFRGETAAVTIHQVIYQDPVPPSRLNSAVPRDLETICLKCLQKASRQRYPSAAALADDLGRYERGEPITARPVSRSERVARWIRRKPAAAALVVTALALLVAAVMVGANRWRLETMRRAAMAEWTPRLEHVTQLLKDEKFREARALLQDRPAVDVAELNDRIHAALADLDLTQKLDGIRLNRVAVVDGRFDVDANRERSDREYEAALADAGLGAFQDPPSVVAERISASPIRTALVAALDDWAVCTKDRSRRTWVFDVARGADQDPGGWRDHVRDPGLSREALGQLGEQAVVRDQSVQLLVALAQRMQAAGANPTTFLRRVQRQYPGDFWACLTLGDALWEKQREDCIRYYQAALAIRPETAVAHHGVGRALADVGRADEAIEHLREAIRLEPRYAHALGNLGMLLSIKGQYAEALELVKRAVAIDDRSALEQVHLAEVLVRMGRREEAWAARRRAVALDPDNLNARITFAFDLMMGNRYKEAVEHLDHARRAHPDSPWPHYVMGQLLFRQKRLDEAIAELETATRLDAGMFEAHFFLGECWRERQAPQKALLAYDKALALRPHEGKIIQTRRGVMMQLGLGEAARAEWAEVLKARPPEHDLWYGYAELCLYLGHQDEYERACDELLGRFESSRDPQICERVGRACLLGHVRSEDAARAAALIERAVNADPTRSSTSIRPYFLLAQGLARYRLSDFDGAVRSIQGEAARVHGPLPHLVLSMAHQRAGRIDESLRSFATAIKLYDWSPSRVSDHDAWLYHILRREAELLVMPNLAKLLTAQAKPRDQDERLALIAVCQSMQRTATATRLYAEAFAHDSGLPNQQAHRYDAACCAARVGTGDGDDAAGLSEEIRARWREQARVWLGDDLAAKRALLGGPPRAEPALLAGQLETWLKEPALARVRDDGELHKLPSAEQQAWRALWRDARSLLAEASVAVSKTAR